MTTPTHPSPSPQPALSLTSGRLPLRLELQQTMGEGALDGTWWPQSRDPNVELADLIDNFPAPLGQVHRVVYSRPDWDTAPRRVRADRGLIKVGSYPREDNHQVWLWMSTRTMIRLSVTTPEEPSVNSPRAATLDRRLAEPVDGDEVVARTPRNGGGGSGRDPHAAPRAGSF
jgi:uncharacterized protein DUF5994